MHQYIMPAPRPDQSRARSVPSRARSPAHQPPFPRQNTRLHRNGPIRMSTPSLRRAEMIPTLNMLHILTYPELYTIAIGGVVDGIALDMEHARAAPMIGGITTEGSAWWR